MLRAEIHSELQLCVLVTCPSRAYTWKETAKQVADHATSCRLVPSAGRSVWSFFDFGGVSGRRMLRCVFRVATIMLAWFRHSLLPLVFNWDKLGRTAALQGASLQVAKQPSSLKRGR